MWARLACINNCMTVARYLGDETGAITEDNKDQWFSCSETPYEAKLVIRHREVGNISGGFSAGFLSEDTNHDVCIPGLIHGVVKVGGAIPLRAPGPKYVFASVPVVEGLQDGLEAFRVCGFICSLPRVGP